jgi:hypothetical protein
MNGVLIGGDVRPECTGPARLGDVGSDSRNSFTYLDVPGANGSAGRVLPRARDSESECSRRGL